MMRVENGILVLFSCWLCAMNLQADTPEVEKARVHGAQGQVTLRVTDSTGKSVEKAQLSVAFFPSDSYADVKISKGETDTNGLFIAGGKTVASISYTINRDGYYKTSGKYWFYRRGEACVQQGRWQPWNPTNTVVLKERRNPVPMYAKKVDAIIPIKDQPVGFDFETGDWVAPQGKGKESDVYFTYRADLKDFWTGIKQLTIACGKKVDGIYRAKKDMWSEFNSTYHASVDGYQPSVELILDATKDKVLKREDIGQSEYLVFRVRTVLDDKDNIVNARYGKIYGPIEYGGQGPHLRFSYYFNPTANDRNLEFDPSQNLFNWKHDARERPYMP